MAEQTLYEAIAFASDADACFHANLVRQFGKKACDARYDGTRTGWDSQTIHACEIKHIRDKDMQAAFERSRA